MKLRYGNPEEAGMSATGVERIRRLAESWVDQEITPSLVVLAARRGTIVLHEAFGNLTPERDSPPLELDAIFPLASISKPIIMILMEEGKIGLNRPVAKYIPEFTGEGKDAVMVHHLLTHTSGLKEGACLEHAVKRKDTAKFSPVEATQNAVIHRYLFLLYDAPLMVPPGKEMSYCNYGYQLLGEIVRRVSGESFADFARERIFEPLGMKDTYFIVPDEVRERIVRRPSSADGAAISEDLRKWAACVEMALEAGSFIESRLSQDTPWAFGGAFSTAMDIAQFGQLFLNRGSYGDTRILSPASVFEMTRNQIPGIDAVYGDEVFPEASWGYGWNVHGSKKGWGGGSLHSSRAFIHGGGGGVHLWVDPEYEIVGVYFSVRMPSGDSVDAFTNMVTAAAIG
jgi:CubicO group peptidase (beta-lactamase class C family)